MSGEAAPAFAASPGDDRTRLPPASGPRRWLEPVVARLRDPNPILLRELRATFRTARFIRFLYLLTGVVVVVVEGGGASLAIAEVAPAEIGSALFQVFFTLLLGTLCVVAAPYASTAFTSEHEAGTYEALVLTNMSAWRITWGKFLAAYASILLVVVAVAPVASIAFLFGGVSPIAVVLAFLWTAGILAVAVAFGLALSARLSSTRIAIVLSSFLWLHASATLFFSFSALGFAAQELWGVASDGPFWVASALAARIDDPTLWLTLAIAPAILIGAATWYLLASTVAGVRHPGEDRSTPLKVWALVCVPLTTGVMSIPMGIADTTGDTMRAGAIMNAIGLCFAVLVGASFANEPPLPPRTPPRSPIVRALWTLVGPGAAGTTRFAMAAAMVPTLGASLVTLLIHHARASAPLGDDDIGVLVSGLGSAVVASAYTAFAMAARLVTRSAIAARSLALLAFAMISMTLVVLGVASHDVSTARDLAAFFLGVSPFGPVMLGIERTSPPTGEPGLLTPALVTIVLHGLGALACWTLVEGLSLRALGAARRRREAAAPAPEPAAGASTP